MFEAYRHLDPPARYTGTFDKFQKTFAEQKAWVKARRCIAGEMDHCTLYD